MRHVHVGVLQIRNQHEVNIDNHPGKDVKAAYVDKTKGVDAIREEGHHHRVAGESTNEEREYEIIRIEREVWKKL